MPVPQGFFTTVHQWWQVPVRETQAFWQALAGAHFSVPREFRHKVGLFGDGIGEPLHHIHENLAPAKVMEVLEALVVERRLPRAVASRVEDTILRTSVGKDGTWI